MFEPVLELLGIGGVVVDGVVLGEDWGDMPLHSKIITVKWILIIKNLNGKLKKEWLNIENIRSSFEVLE